MKKREFLKAMSAMAGASVLSLTPTRSSAAGDSYSSLFYTLESNSGGYDNLTAYGKAMYLERLFCSFTNINTARAGIGLIFTQATSTCDLGDILTQDDSGQFQPRFAKQYPAYSVANPLSGKTCIFWSEINLDYDVSGYLNWQTPPVNPESFFATDDNFPIVFNRIYDSYQPGDQNSNTNIVKREISAGQVAKAMLSGFAVDFTSKAGASAIGGFATIYVPDKINDLLVTLAGKTRAQDIMNWMSGISSFSSGCLSAAYSSYIAYAMGKWIYQNPKFATTALGMYAALQYFAPVVLAMFGAVLPVIVATGGSVNANLVPSDGATSWYAFYGRDIFQTLLSDILPGIQVPPVVKAVVSNSQVIYEFDYSVLGIKVLAAVAYFGTSYVTSAASKLIADEFHQNSTVLGFVITSTFSSINEGCDASINALLNSFHPSGVYKPMDNGMNSALGSRLIAVADKLRDVTWHSNPLSRDLSFNTGYLEAYLNSTSLPWGAQVALTSLSNAQTELRKVWVAMAYAMVFADPAQASPGYGPPDHVAPSPLPNPNAPSDYNHVVIETGGVTYISLNPVYVDAPGGTVTVNVQTPAAQNM